jgi:hypothetical protein
VEEIFMAAASISPWEVSTVTPAEIWANDGKGRFREDAESPATPLPPHCPAFKGGLTVGQSHVPSREGFLKRPRRHFWWPRRTFRYGSSGSIHGFISRPLKTGTV